MSNIFLIISIANLMLAILSTIQGNYQVSGIGGWICVILLILSKKREESNE